jgi:hypothetical protein
MTHAGKANLVMFDDTEEGRARARELGRKGGQTRARNAAAKRGLATKTGQERALSLTEVTTRFNRADLSENAAAVANLLLGRIAAGEIKVDGRDVSALLDVLVTIVRLEEGLATSHHQTVSVTGDVMARIEALRAQHGGPMVGDDLTIRDSVEVNGRELTVESSELEVCSDEGVGEGG